MGVTDCIARRRVGSTPMTTLPSPGRPSRNPRGRASPWRVSPGHDRGGVQLSRQRASPRAWLRAPGTPGHALCHRHLLDSTRLLDLRLLAASVFTTKGRVNEL